ncbi:MAG: glycosyltransferase [Pseudomonadota bacterium]
MTRSLHFLVHAVMDESTIAHSIGMPEYSYYFVMQDFIPLLERIGRVTVLKNPENEIESIFKKSQESGDECLFLNFTAPQNFIDGLQCPTIHVFAWEFDTIPTESWLQDGRQDWRVALRQHKSAITHSEYAKSAILEAMGQEFPVAVVPSPVWDKQDLGRSVIDKRNPIKSADLHFVGRFFDTRQIEMFYDIGTFRSGRSLLSNPAPKESEAESHSQNVTRRLVKQLIPPIVWNAFAPSPGQATQSDADRNSARATDPEDTDRVSYTTERANTLALEGVVYTSIFNPLDGRKNWQDMVSAFIWAHKERSDAILLIKTPKLDVHDFVEPLIEFLKRFQPFNCRVVILKAFLDDDQFQALREATTFYVNTSYGEGQCLPLMEYLSAGIPAIAPSTTALGDYIESDIAFVVDAHAEPSTWQHDPRLSYRALRYRVDWLELVDAFEQSYHLARNDAPAWRAMGTAAASRLKDHCSLDKTELVLRQFLETVDQKTTI